MEILKTGQVKTETPQGKLVPKASDFQPMQVAKQRHATFFVHQGIDRIFEKDRVVFLQCTRFQPNLMQRDFLLGSDEPVDAALKSVALALPAGGDSSRTSSFLQYKRLDA
jgi:hypothetical protein